MRKPRIEYEIIAADGSWLGATTRPEMAEGMLAIWPGSVVIITNTREPTLIGSHT